MTSEETVYDKEKTPTRENKPATQANATNKNPELTPKKKKGNAGVIVGVGAAAGVLLGAAGAILSANAAEQPPVDDGNTEENTNTEKSVDNDTTSGIIDDSIDVAESVNDDMSFSEAFQEAREEVGPGGAFEWHGNIYSTFTAEEWNEMSAEEKEEYNSHFNWGAESDDATTGETPEPENNVTSIAEAGVDINIDGDGNNVTVIVNPENQEDGGEPLPGDPELPETPILEPTPTIDADDVEILGVVELPDGGNAGLLDVDGQEVVLVDVDGTDDTFEFMASDLNADGVLDDSEVVDISEDNISVSEFADNYLGDDAYYAMDDTTDDYINDADDCCMA